jgi:peptidyl-prolyl cis-trans isomerase SurA
MFNDADFSKLKGSFTEEEFEKRLAERKMTAEDLKADIRKKLSIEKLIAKENHLEDQHHR